jgi:hypothetical protein
LGSSSDHTNIWVSSTITCRHVPWLCLPERLRAASSPILHRRVL